MLRFLKTSFREWRENNVSQLAAGITYYTIFSLAPLLVVAIAIAGFFFGQETARGEILSQIRDMLGPGGAIFFQGIIQNIADVKSNVLTPLIGIILLAYGASRAFRELQAAFNTIWGVTSSSKNWIVVQIQRRILAYTMVLGIGLLLIISLSASTLLSLAANLVGELVPGNLPGLQILNEWVAFGVVAVLFATLYKILPETGVRWKDAWRGGVLASLLYNTGKFLIGYYLGVSGVGSIYGTAGTIMLLLLWTYYSIQILLMGAIFAKVFSQLGIEHTSTP